MKSRIPFCLFLVLLIISCKHKTLVYEEVDGLVAVEAEHFSAQTHSEIRSWYIHSVLDSSDVKPDLDFNHSQTASNKSYIEILPDTRVTHSDKLVRGENFSANAGEMAVVSYKIYFNNPGKYFVWVRAYSSGSEDNGVHVGVNGAWPESGQRMQWCEGKNQWTWASKQRTEEKHCGVPGLIFLEIPSKGLHTISFSMREDGFEMDKFILSKVYTEPEGLDQIETTKLINIKELQ